MNDYDHGHAWDARYSKSESKSETIGTVFSEKEIHNATIDAACRAILEFKGWDKEPCPWSKCCKINIDQIAEKIKSMKRG